MRCGVKGRLTMRVENRSLKSLEKGRSSSVMRRSLDDVWCIFFCGNGLVGPDDGEGEGLRSNWRRRSVGANALDLPLSEGMLSPDGRDLSGKRRSSGRGGDCMLSWLFTSGCVVAGAVAAPSSSLFDRLLEDDEECSDWEDVAERGTKGESALAVLSRAMDASDIRRVSMSLLLERVLMLMGSGSRTSDV